MTKEQRIQHYYRTGLSCFHAGRRADAALMVAAIRCFEPRHPLAARLRAVLTRGDYAAIEADDATTWQYDDEADINRGFVRWRHPAASPAISTSPGDQN